MGHIDYIDETPTSNHIFPQQFLSPLISLLQETMYDPRKTQSPLSYNHQNISYESDQLGMTNFADKNREAAQIYESSCANLYSKGVVQFRPNDHHQEAMASDHSGENSPPLWKNSPSPSHPLLSHHHHHRLLSPNPRAQAIARGQWELMEMVKNMPESSYELSLKDLVEHHRVDQDTQAPNYQAAGERERPVHNHQQNSLQVKRLESNKNERNVMRSRSFENKGLFLNMVFPFSFKSKKNNKFVSSSSGKVSPKPEGLKGGSERDWWKKRFTGSTDSDSSRTTNKSGSSGSTERSSGSSSSGGGGCSNRKKDGCVTGCWPRKSKSVE